MIKIGIFFDNDNFDKALELFNNFCDELEESAINIIKTKTSYRIMTEMFMIDLISINGSYCRGEKYNIIYLPMDSIYSKDSKFSRVYGNLITAIKSY